MTTPQLSAPTLFTPSELRSEPAITDQIINLANDAFRRSKLPEPEKWDFTRPRFPTPESYYAMLDAESVVVLIFDENAHSRDGNGAQQDAAHSSSRLNGSPRGKVVGCAAAVPWKGGWAKEGADTEEGFEIKAICVDGYENYLRRGLAVQMMDFLTDFLVGEAKSSRAARQNISDKKHLSLWILAADCINGAYWHRRGYHEVRRTTEGEGTWGCKTTFDMVVLRKDVEYNL